MQFNRIQKPLIFNAGIRMRKLAPIAGGLFNVLARGKYPRLLAGGADFSVDNRGDRRDRRDHIFQMLVTIANMSKSMYSVRSTHVLAGCSLMRTYAPVSMNMIAMMSATMHRDE